MVPIAAIISAIASVAGAAISSKNSQKSESGDASLSGGASANSSFTDSQRSAMAINAASNLFEKGYNEYLYNKYQSPAAMVRQYSEAGLNPMLLTGGSFGSPASGGTPLQADGYSVPDMMSTIMNVALTKEQIEDIKAGVRQKDADTALKNAQTANTEVQTSIAEIEKQYADRLASARASHEESEVKKLTFDMAESAARTRLTAAQADNYVELVKSEIFGNYNGSIQRALLHTIQESANKFTNDIKDLNVAGNKWTASPAFYDTVKQAYFDITGRSYESDAGTDKFDSKAMDTAINVALAAQSSKKSD